MVTKMVQWTTTEIAVFIAVALMIVFKLWSVWHVSVKAKASREGRFIFLGGISAMSLFGIGAKLFISYQMGM
mgnify:CR=1 FL=1